MFRFTLSWISVLWRSFLCVPFNNMDLRFEIEYLWGQQSGSLDPVAFFCLGKGSLLPIDFSVMKIEKSSMEWLLELKYCATGFSRCQCLMSNSWPFHLYVECIFNFTHVLLSASFAFYHVDPVWCFAFSHGFYFVWFPGGRAVEYFHPFHIVARFTMGLTTLGITLVR